MQSSGGRSTSATREVRVRSRSIQWWIRSGSGARRQAHHQVSDVDVLGVVDVFVGLALVPQLVPDGETRRPLQHHEIPGRRTLQREHQQGTCASMAAASKSSAFPTK